jgi:integrase
MPSRQGFFDGVNPVVDTAIPPAPKGGDTYAYSLEEVTRMLAVLAEPARTIVAVAAFTGARRGEIRGMLWENFRDDSIFIAHSMWESHINEPKTKASKAPVPVVRQLGAMLGRHRERLGNPVSGVMFPATNGKPVSLNNVLNRSILPVLRQAGIATTQNLYIKSVDEDSVTAMDSLEKSLPCADCAPGATVFPSNRVN